jgi:hypothetical protein
MRKRAPIAARPLKAAPGLPKRTLRNVHGRTAAKLEAVGAPGEEPDGWVLHRASSGLGPWFTWSAGAQTLALGSAFSATLMLLSGQLDLPGAWTASLRAASAAAAIAAYAPLLALSLLHRKRRVRAVAIDPAGITLRVRTGEHRVLFSQMRQVRTRAEPVFSRGRALRDAFVPSVQVVEANGRTWEFATARMPDLLAVLAWLQVLAPEAVPLPPSALAAKHRAEDATERAKRWLLAAMGFAAVCCVLQALRLARAMPAMTPVLVACSVAAISAACALYLVSYRAQLDAGRQWLMARGLNTGPPLPA